MSISTEEREPKRPWSGIDGGLIEYKRRQEQVPCQIPLELPLPEYPPEPETSEAEEEQHVIIIEL